MKTAYLMLRVTLGILVMLLAANPPTAVAAPPAGEVKTIAPTLGNGVPIPYLDLSHCNDWMQLLYDNLVGCTPQGALSPDLGLAHKWEMSPDGLTWTFFLKKGIRFHDGVEVSAKDVKFSIEQLMRPDSLSGKAADIRGDVKSIEVKDPYTVIIHCKRPSIFMASMLSSMESPSGMVVPKDYYERVGKDEFAKRPIGSGPYKWHSQQIGGFIKLEATDKHWRDGVPRYKYMTYLIIPEESTRLAMLRTGEADITRISKDGVKEAVNAGLNVLTKESAAAVVLHANMQWTSPVFSDIRFRKALNLAINKEAIIKQLFAGLAKPIANWPGSTIFAVGADRTLKPYGYDPQEARRMIKEGGWDGHEFTLVSYDRAGCPEFPLVVEAVAGFWQRIGLNPRIRISEWSTWREAARERKSQNSVNGYDDTTNPEASSILIKMKQKWYFKDSRSTVNIPEINEKFERIEKSKDLVEISKLMADIYRYAYDQYLMIPICEIPEKIAITKRVPAWDPGLRRNDRNYSDLIRQR